MAENNNLLKEKAQIVTNLKKMQEEIGKNEARQTDEYMTQQKRLKEILTELKRIKSETEASLGVTESFASSLGGIYRNLDNNLSSQKTLVDGLQSKFVEIEASAGGFNAANLKSREQIGNILTGYSLLQELQNEISQLTLEDVEQRQLLNQQISDSQQLIQEEVNQLDKRTTLGKEFMSIQTQLNSKAQQRTEEAKKLGALTEKEKEVLETQLRVFENITSKISALEDSLLTFIRRPQAAVGGLLVAFGSVVNKIGDVNKELGTTLFQSDGVGRKAGVLSFIFEDAAGTAKNLSSELGSTDRATFGLQTNVGLMAMNMGISNSEAATLVGSFTRLNGNSTDIASDMVATSREFAKQNGIIPAQLMGDLAQSAEEFALFGKQGGKNILEAAGFAAKLGVSMKTISGVSENLLDFESSITKELELGAMLGRNINLNKARELAFQGDIEGAAKETLNALGGQAAFEQMNYYQRKQTAELLGVSVAELQKMVTNEEQAATLGSVISKNFSEAGEIINGGLNKYLGTSIQALGGMVASGAEFGANISMMLPTMKGLSEKIGGMFANLKGVSKTVTNTVDVTTDIGSSVTSNIPEGAGQGISGKGSITDGLSKIKPQQILAGAAALVIVAGAVFVFGKAVQEFMEVSWSAVGKAVVSMLALVGSVALLGSIMSSPIGAYAILAGAAAMLVVAGSVFVLGKALQEIGKGFEMIGSVGMVITQLTNNIEPIMLLTGSLFALAGALTAVGTAGIVSIPGLVALGAIGSAVRGINSLLGIESETTTAVIGGSNDGDKQSLSQYETDALRYLERIAVASEKGATIKGRDRSAFNPMGISNS